MVFLRARLGVVLSGALGPLFLAGSAVLTETWLVVAADSDAGMHGPL